MKAFIVCASLGIAAVGACPSASAFYHLESAIILKSAEPDWDYLTLDPRRGYLFIGRRGDGAAVFDIKTHKVVRTISNSEEAGAIVLVPEFDRGYTANEDGTTTVFQLSTLKSLGRVKFGADCDSGFYDPATKQIMFTMADSNAVAFVDAKTGNPVGTLAIDSSKIEASAPDGQGHIFTALRDRNAVVKIDSRRERSSINGIRPTATSQRGLPTIRSTSAFSSAAGARSRCSRSSMLTRVG